MELGAVKQAFNNELILLKKWLNQAKTQIIHKLTRKAKTLTAKKGPEQILEKNMRKAKAAVAEILIMKKIKVKDIGKFIVTHTGELQNHINKPEVDLDKACARILLHNAMQEKYKFIRNRFIDVPINDLFMSKQERLKLKKEAKQKQKEKKKRGKQKMKSDMGNTDNGWKVEDIEMGDISKISEDNDVSDDSGMTVGINEASDDGGQQKTVSDNNLATESDNNIDSDMIVETDKGKRIDECKEVSDRSQDVGEFGKFVRIKPIKKDSLAKKESMPMKINTLPKKHILDANKKIKPDLDIKETSSEISETKIKLLEQEIKKKQEKKQKDKNKNFSEKILQRKFKKDVNELVTEGNKVVDSFFVTSTGENYMSVVEPRLPDEVKDIHKQGNRKQRRAAMFGYVPRHKPRRDEYSKNNYSNYNVNDKNDRLIMNNFDKLNRKVDSLNSSFNNHNQFNKTDKKFVKHNSKELHNKRFDEEKSNSQKPESRTCEGRNPRWSLGNDEKEKLHPSWEAKKRQSGILPFQGKKIVFNDD